jgi:hypothetical protein
MAQPNQLNPRFTRIELPCNALPAIITGGESCTSAEIIAEIGTPGTDYAAGSFYISGDASTPGVWVAVGTSWTSLTID